jgi:hypothetical protein
MSRARPTVHRTGLSRAGGRLRAVCLTCSWHGPDRGPWPNLSARSCDLAVSDAWRHKGWRR